VISVDEALEIVASHISALDPEDVSFELACGRLLREDVASDTDLPPFPRSAVDGFALRAADVSGTPATLEIIGEVPAGSFPSFQIGAGEAAQIMTGAPVPDGADAVQMVEQTRVDADRVEVRERVEAGQNIAPRGSEVANGAVVLREGTRLDPATIAVAATVGKTSLRVGRRPEVAVIATGDELVHPTTTPAPGQIRNSNGFSLVAQCEQVGATAHYLGVATDDEASLTQLIRAGLEKDVLLLSGGVSMGRFDLVEPVLEREGVEILFESVALKPGKPLVFGRTNDGTLVFGLPGNPVSTMVTFELFVRTALARLEGAPSPSRPYVTASLSGPLRNRGRRRAFLPGWLSVGTDGRLVAHPITTRGSGDIVAFAKANALVVSGEDDDIHATGDVVQVYPLDSFFHREDRWQNPANPR